MTFGLCVLLLSSCKPAQVAAPTGHTGKSVRLSSTHTLVLADVAEGERRITTDAREDFFESVRELDMQIQMSDASRGDRATLLKDYRKHLASSVLPWSKAEEKELQAVMETVFELVSAVSPDLFPETVVLVQTNMNHYGPGTFYTRDNAIIIPQNMMAQVKTEGFLQTMLHEIFHIYSRYNPRKREALYAHIGYQKIAPPLIPDMLDRRILLNPDGIDFQYGIRVKRKSTGAEITVIPLIYSKYLSYVPTRKGFFNYLGFSLFEVADGEVQLTRNGESTVPLTNITGFREQIGPNTDYIIHPDEVLADNFAFMCMAKGQESNFTQMGITKAGMEQIKALREIMLRP